METKIELGKSVRPPIIFSLRSSVRGILGKSSNISLWDSINDSVDRPVYNSVGNSVERPINNSIRWGIRL